MVLFEIIIATAIVSVISFTGVILLGLKQKILNKVIPLMVAFAAGVLLGDAFIHIMPEAVNKTGQAGPVLFSVLIGMIAFFAIEKFLLWHHHKEDHKDDEKFMPGAKYSVGMILFGDGIHNFFDGVLIAASFISDFRLGVITTFGILLHEIPQEIGDFAVLINGGLSYKTAAWYNFLSALTAEAGGIIAFFFLTQATALTEAALPFAGGGLLYIAASDLVPELHREVKLKESIAQLILLILGVAVMYYVKLFGV